MQILPTFRPSFSLRLHMKSRVLSGYIPHQFLAIRPLYCKPPLDACLLVASTGESKINNFTYRDQIDFVHSERPIMINTFLFPTPTNLVIRCGRPG